MNTSLMSLPLNIRLQPAVGKKKTTLCKCHGYMIFIFSEQICLIIAQDEILCRGHQKPSSPVERGAHFMAIWPVNVKNKQGDLMSSTRHQVDQLALQQHRKFNIIQSLLHHVVRKLCAL